MTGDLWEMKLDGGSKIDPWLQAEFKEIARSIIARDRQAKKLGRSQIPSGIWETCEPDVALAADIQATRGLPNCLRNGD